MTNKKCTNLQKPSSFWRSLFLFFSALIVLPLALTLLLIKQILRFMTLRIRRPMIKEPIYFIRSEAVTEIDEWNNYDDEKKTIEIARFLAERNFDIPNKQNNEQNDLTKFPEIPYDDPLR